MCRVPIVTPGRHERKESLNQQRGAHYNDDRVSSSCGRIADLLETGGTYSFVSGRPGYNGRPHFAELAFTSRRGTGDIYYRRYIELLENALLIG